LAEHVLTVRVESAALRETGDRRGRAGENLVNVLLLWPRPGKAEVLGTTGLVRLADRPAKAQGVDRPSAFAALVLKEVVEGECALLVHVTDRDEPTKLARFLRRLAAATLEGGGAGVAAGMSGILRHAFTEAVETGSMFVAGEKEGDERVDLVGVGESPLLLSSSDIADMAASRERRHVEVALVAPPDLARPREKGRLAPGRGNGSLTLELAVYSR
jgi:hypothetical protein